MLDNLAEGNAVERFISKWELFIYVHDTSLKPESRDTVNGRRRDVRALKLAFR